MKQFGAALVVLAMVLSAPSWASSKTAKKPDAKVVDAGSFGIFLNGKRIATEKFEIQQRDGYSVTSSEVKMEDGSKAEQASELQVLSNGNLKKYEWHEVSPGKARATVAPSEQFLVERLAPEAGAKETEVAFILPASTQVVDDYFFSHREVLMWRYIASVCSAPGANNKCKMEKSQFGIFVPRQQSPITVTLEYKGSEKVQLKGAERQLERFDMTVEGQAWSMWLDPTDNYKLQRIMIAAENTEIVRD